MNDCNEPGDQTGALGNAVFPIQLMFESDGLFYYSAHCCQTGENSHWGVITSRRKCLKTGCLAPKVEGPVLKWNQGAPGNGSDSISTVVVSNDVDTSVPGCEGLAIDLEAKAKLVKIEGDFVVKIRLADSTIQLDTCYQRLLKVMFELYQVDYEYSGDGVVPHTKLQLMFARNPRTIVGKPKDLPLEWSTMASKIVFGKTSGFASDQLVISEWESKGET